MTFAEFVCFLIASSGLAWATQSPPNASAATAKSASVASFAESVTSAKPISAAPPSGTTPPSWSGFTSENPASATTGRLLLHPGPNREPGRDAERDDPGARDRYAETARGTNDVFFEGFPVSISRV
jgi:hypothetical protein